MTRLFALIGILAADLFAVPRGAGAQDLAIVNARILDGRGGDPAR